MYSVIDGTQFGWDTEHGFQTPHAYPSDYETLDLINSLSSNLYPTGRVWSLSENSDFKKYHDAINLSFSRFLDFALNVINNTLPDNEFFDLEDAGLWEYRLGLITNENLPLSLRRNNLLNKLSYPNKIKARQGFRYIQNQLNLYGFDVKIYENIFFNEDGSKYYKLPSEVLGEIQVQTQHGLPTQHGTSTQHGAGSFEIIANSAYDEVFNIGGEDNLWSTFFIAGNSINEIATIPNSRKTEFRELVLKLKPAHLVGFLYINFI